VLLIDVDIRPSGLHGLGVFAREPVARGTIVWELAPELDLVLDESTVARLPERARATLLHYSFWNSRLGRYVLCFDDARFINHADDPNTDGRRAVRDIAAGEEITYPYGRRDLASLPPRKVGADAVPRLIELLGGSDRDLRLFAAKSLAAAGADAAPAARALAAALGDEGRLTRYYAAKALSKVGPAAAAAELELTAALADPDPRLRYYAAKALGRIESLGAPAQESLRARLDDPDPEVSAAARRALERRPRGSNSAT